MSNEKFLKLNQKLLKLKQKLLFKRKIQLSKGGGETVSSDTSASSQAQQENQEKKAEADLVQTKALEETSTQVQPIGMSTFRKVPDAYQSFIPDELKGQVDAFYGSSGKLHVV